MVKDFTLDIDFRDFAGDDLEGDSNVLDSTAELSAAELFRRRLNFPLSLVFSSIS